MKLSTLPKTTTKSKKRIGLGYGSGVGGHTSTRGQKGQTSRGTIPHWFEGGQLPTIRRFPFIKGKNRFKTLNLETKVITLTQLEKLDTNSKVDLKSLIDAKVITSKDLNRYNFKVVANGKLTKALTVSVPTTGAAAEAIQAAGGSVVIE